MKRIITLLLFLTVIGTAWTQGLQKQPTFTVTGTITDARTGETLIGATIYDTLSHKAPSPTSMAATASR